MKSTKLVLVALALVATSASALELDKKLSVAPVEAKTNFAKIEYAFRDYDGNAANKNGFNLTVGGVVAPGIALDLKTEFRLTNGSETISNRVEAGATYDIGTYRDVKFAVRGGLGEKFTNGDNFTYYSIEPSASYAINDDVTVTTSYRFRDAFNNARAEETHQVKVGGAYKLTENTALVASIGRSWGDVQYNSVNVGYRIKF